MIVTNEKIEVSTLMMERANMKKDAFTYGVPVDPKDPARGLRWTHLAKLTDADFDAIEEYFLLLKSRPPHAK